MDQYLLDTVKNAAVEVHNWAKSRAAPCDEDLCGWCAKASAKLFQDLQKKNVPAEIHLHVGEMNAHVFLIVDDHVVDVTATQFNAFKDTNVVILHQREAEAYEFYKSTRTFRSVAELRRYQIRERWPNYQIAYPR